MELNHQKERVGATIIHLINLQLSIMSRVGYNQLSKEETDYLNTSYCSPDSELLSAEKLGNELKKMGKEKI